MTHTFMCISYASEHPEELKKVMNSLSMPIPNEIIVDRFKMSFDPQSQTVTIDKAAPDVEFYWKINPCRMPYATLKKLLNKEYGDMEGFEWL